MESIKRKQQDLDLEVKLWAIIATVEAKTKKITTRQVCWNAWAGQT